MSERLVFLDGKRAMISLGPFANAQHCPYRCAFCYVQDGFKQYASLDEDAILKFLTDNRDKYNIIYVSGDTDSFAHPRTQRALSLIERIVLETDCDVLFTTRTTFTDGDYVILERIIKEQRRTNNNLFACISITRYSEDVSYLEPKPIPTPDERIEVLKRLKQIGATTVLAMRPFLPVVNVNDYLTILDKTKGYIDIALGECFYFIPDGKICKRVFPNGIPEAAQKNITHGNKMTFDDNDEEWDIWDSTEYEQVVHKRCDDLGIIFSMHSEEAIEEFLKMKGKYNG